MRSNKCTQFVQTLNTVLKLNSRNYVKRTLGDSTNNNRTLSVSQVIRFLNRTGRVQLAEQLSAVYVRLGEVILNDRTVTNRSDAVDINEFLNVYTAVIDDTTIVRSLSQVLSKAA